MWPTPSAEDKGFQIVSNSLGSRFMRWRRPNMKEHGISVDMADEGSTTPTESGQVRGFGLVRMDPRSRTNPLRHASTGEAATDNLQSFSIDFSEEPTPWYAEGTQYQGYSMSGAVPVQRQHKATVDEYLSAQASRGAGPVQPRYVVAADEYFGIEGPEGPYNVNMELPGYKQAKSSREGSVI